MLFIFAFLLLNLLLFFLSRLLVRDISNVFYRITKSKKWTIYLLAILFLPGTFIHEIAHFLTALFLFVPVGEVEFIPTFEEKGRVKLASVSIGKADSLRRTLIGIAPFILGTGVILASISYAINANLTGNFWALVILGYIVFEVGNTMFASRKDLEGVGTLLLILAIFYAAFLLLGFRLPAFDPTTLLTDKVVSLFKTADTFLLVPVFVDILAIFALRLFRFLFIS